jgi:hypothetical protein
MIKNKIHCQNLAYCRYLHIWSILYFLNIIKSSPLISLLIVSFLHLFSLEFNSKRIGILITDYILITIIYNGDKKLYIGINIIVFLIYMKILFLININPIKLYTKYLKNDDKKFKDENYFSYLKRVWFLFLVNNNNKITYVIR